MEEAGVAPSIGALGRSKVSHRLGAEEQSEGGTHPVQLRGHTGGGQRVLNAGLEASAKSIESFVGRLVQLAQDSQPSGHGRDLRHDHALSAENPERQASAHNLAQAGQVRPHPEKRLGTAAADPETRNDLVEDQ